MNDGRGERENVCVRERKLEGRALVGASEEASKNIVNEYHEISALPWFHGEVKIVGVSGVVEEGESVSVRMRASPKLLQIW